MYFQALDYKENYFLDLLNNDYLLIKPIYMKGGAWLKLLGHLNSFRLLVIRRECGQTLGRVRVRTVVIISLQRT